MLSREEIVEKVRETAELGGRQILIQGGHHPYLKTDWWCTLLSEIRSKFPLINPHALSATRIGLLSGSGGISLQ